jgi:aldehyde dehydrogenase (NAD+)
VVLGGQRDAADRYFAPTVLTEVDLDHPLMQEEIFGPLLPIIEVGDLAEAAAFVRTRPTPLALYLFSNDRRRIEQLLAQVPSGGALVNDTLVHMANRALPLGGLGASGMGSFHGKASFDAFTHWRSVMSRSLFPDLGLRYPPYRLPLAWLRRLIG